MQLIRERDVEEAILEGVRAALAEYLDLRRRFSGNYELSGIIENRQRLISWYYEMFRENVRRNKAELAIQCWLDVWRTVGEVLVLMDAHEEEEVRE